jgi:hypothetical protein
MGIPERSRERVEAYIAGLEETYGTFPVNQTTVSLPGERYDAVRERERETGGFVDAYVQVQNGDRNVLHVARNGHADLPGVRVAMDTRTEQQVRAAVRKRTGIECTIDGVERATIAGVRHAGDTDRGTLYHVVVVFSGRQVSGTPVEDAVWQPSANAVEVLAR